MSLRMIVLGLVVVQWRACRDDPRDRAALRWLGLSAVIMAGLFVVTPESAMHAMHHGGGFRAHLYGMWAAFVIAGLAAGIAGSLSWCITGFLCSPGLRKISR